VPPPCKSSSIRPASTVVAPTTHHVPITAKKIRRFTKDNIIVVHLLNPAANVFNVLLTVIVNPKEPIIAKTKNVVEAP
jgi:hypothetical protein